ncbi:MAG: hypothetical protein MR637_04510 [Clostridiales bacterium]|nr:hypothetical protein [Clostridiales bacterium]
MMKRLLCLLLAILLPICPLSVALAEAQHTPYRPGALTRSLFLEAFQRGDAVCADLGQSLTLNAEALGLTGEDAELLSAVMDALSHTQITAAAVKLEDGVLLELAGTYFTEEDSVSIDAQLEITKTGLALTSDTVLPGERVTVTWETLLALLGVSEEDAGQLLALRSMSLQQLQEAAESYIRMFILMAQQLAAPYAQILSDFVAAQPVSVEENVAAEGFFPAAAKETAVIVTSKAVGELLVTLCNQLEQDAALAPMLDALLAQAEPDSGIPSTTAALCAAVRQEAMTLTDEEYPLYLVTGTDADGRPLYGSLCAVLEDGSTAAINLIDCAETPEDGLSCLLQVFASDPEGVYTGLTASLDHTADPQAISLSIAADVQAGDQSLFSTAIDMDTEPMITEEGLSGYSSTYSYTATIPDEGGPITISCYGEAEHALTADGGESAYSFGVSETYLGDELLQQTSAQAGFAVVPGENGPEGEYIEQITSPQTGIDEAAFGLWLYTLPYTPAEELTELSLDSASEEDVQALLIRAMTSIQEPMDALFALLPEELLTLIAGEAAPQEAPATPAEAE